jgi:class 3 adenylate cyclase
MEPPSIQISNIRLRLRATKAFSPETISLLDEIDEMGDSRQLIPDLIAAMRRGVYFPTSPLVSIIARLKSEELLHAALEQYEGEWSLSTFDRCTLLIAGFLQFQDPLLEELFQMFENDAEPRRSAIVEAFSTSGTLSALETLRVIEYRTAERIPELIKELRDNDRITQARIMVERGDFVGLREQFLTQVRQAIRLITERSSSTDTALGSQAIRGEQEGQVCVNSGEFITKVHEDNYAMQTLPILQTPTKADAIALIAEQIKRGRHASIRQPLEKGSKASEQRSAKWESETNQLLLKMFDTDRLAKEYEEIASNVRLAGAYTSQDRINKHEARLDAKINWLKELQRRIQHHFAEPIEASQGSSSLHAWAGVKKNGERVMLAVVFTDIVDSTATAVQFGDKAMYELLVKHFNSARRYCQLYGGHEIKLIGDAYMAVFRTADDALQFARSFCVDTGDHRIAIRAGIHLGQVRISDNDIYGLMVNYASRLQHVISGEGIVVSDVVKREVVSEHGTDNGFTQLPSADLKGFSNNEPIWFFGDFDA